MFDPQGPYSFPHMGSPQGRGFFNEAAPMYREAAIKASFPKNLCDYMVEIANKVSFVFDGHLNARKQSHERRRVLRPLIHWLKKTSNKKEASLKYKGLI
jgi:hypothetical protein